MLVALASTVIRFVTHSAEGRVGLIDGVGLSQRIRGMGIARLRVYSSSEDGSHS
jgi:hypothetical protein